MSKTFIYNEDEEFTREENSADSVLFVLLKTLLFFVTEKLKSVRYTDKIQNNWKPNEH